MEKVRARANFDPVHQDKPRSELAALNICNNMRFSTCVGLHIWYGNYLIGRLAIASQSEGHGFNFVSKQSLAFGIKSDFHKRRVTYSLSGGTIDGAQCLSYFSPVRPDKNDGVEWLSSLFEVVF